MNKFAQYLKANSERQSDFAERIGTTQATVSRLAAGTQTPSPELAIKIDSATGGAVPAASWPAYAAFAVKAGAA
jgi:transcriptional regulator with XRE-family HTH domain